MSVRKVNNICKQSRNFSFCVALLKSSPATDLVTLTQYTINVARVNITNTIKLIKLLISQSARDPKANNHYASCLVHFNYDEGALGQVRYAEELLKKRDYQGVGVAATAILTYVEDCISGESPSDPPYPDHSKLPKYAHFNDMLSLNGKNNLHENINI
ncbi:hypothetical protein CR513_22869, partial [Mucuna pruriens]